jgi:hypothetical protein
MDDKTHEFLAMRAEWLKVRGYLYDPNTSLPAMPAVLEDVRRRVEKGERVGVVYLDSTAGRPMTACCSRWRRLSATCAAS